MNKQRKKALQDVQDRLDQIREDLETLTNEEEEYRDNIPENHQGSERFERAEEVCGLLTDALDSLDSALENIEQAAE